VCDTLPPTASIPLPFSAQDILDLHPTVILGTAGVWPPITKKSCVHPWHRPLQWTSWQHIWPTNPPRTRKQGTAQRASALATTPPLPSLRARPLLPLTMASSPQDSPTQLDPHPISPTLASSNFGNWRTMFDSSTETHLNAGTTRFLGNSRLCKGRYLALLRCLSPLGAPI